MVFVKQHNEPLALIMHDIITYITEKGDFFGACYKCHIFELFYTISKQRTNCRRLLSHISIHRFGSPEGKLIDQQFQFS